MAKKNALGRGLDALITFNDGETQGSSYINEVELDKIVPNPDQPRRIFNEEARRSWLPLSDLLGWSTGYAAKVR